MLLSRGFPCHAGNGRLTRHNARHAESDAQLTVLYPMFDLRGRAVDRVRTWTHAQTLARDRYRVVVASDGTAAPQEPEVAALLGPHDELLRLPGAATRRCGMPGRPRRGPPGSCSPKGTVWRTPGVSMRSPGGSRRARPPRSETSTSGTTPLLRAAEPALVRHDPCTLARARRVAQVSRSGFVVHADVFRAIGGSSPSTASSPGPPRRAVACQRDQDRGRPGARVVHLDNAEMHAHHADRRLRARRARRACAQRAGVLAILRPRTGVDEPAPSPAPHRALHGPRRHHGGHGPSGARGRARRAPAGARDRHDRRLPLRGRRSIDSSSRSTRSRCFLCRPDGAGRATSALTPA